MDTPIIDPRRMLPDLKAPTIEQRFAEWHAWLDREARRCSLGLPAGVLGLPAHAGSYALEAHRRHFAGRLA